MQTIMETPEPSTPRCSRRQDSQHFRIRQISADPNTWGRSSTSRAAATAQIVAGFSPVPTTPTASDPSPPKPYQVAVAIPTGSNSAPLFGTELPQFEGNVYTKNSISHPNLEFSIRDFSELYKEETGQTLNASSVIYLGGFGGSGEDTGIGEAFFPEQPVNIGAATLPNSCPPASPPILINPHEHRVIDTSHRDLVRVTCRARRALV